MSSPIRVGRRLLVVPVALAVLVLLGLGAYGLGYRLNLMTGRVSVPATGASAEQVSLAYMDAFNHRDTATMAALFPSRGTVSRFRAIGHYTHVQVTAGHPMSASERAGGVGDDHREAYLVAVRLDYTGFNDTEMSYRTGPNGWNYYLVRDDPRERWTIADQGVL